MAMPSSADPAELSRRERRKLEVHERILEAARTLFGEKGVAATTVAEICERADVAQKTFFNHFPGRQELVREMARTGLDQLLTNVEEARKKPGTTRERLLAFFTCIADNAEAVGPMYRELLTEIIHVAQDTTSEPEQARRLHEAFGGLVAEGIALGDVTRAHDPETLTEMIVGAYYALMFNWAHLEGYQLRRHALAAARFLGDAFATAT
jgi:AcrR family transcriptional regulator